MNREEFYTMLKDKLYALIQENNLDLDEVSICTKGLTAEHAIGKTLRRDFPILTGKEVMLQATYKGCSGQAFTSAPLEYVGSLREVLEGDIVGDEHSLSLFIATLNAVMRYLNMVDATIHCKNDGPEICGGKYVEYIKETYGPSAKVLLVGYQPAFLAHLSEQFEMHCLDLNPENIGSECNGVVVEDGHNFEELRDWADVIMCTGSTIANASILDYVGLDKDVIFYGTSAAGAAELMGLKRLCFCGE